MRNKVKELRKARGLRQEDVAKLLGVTRQTINAIENDKYDPPAGGSGGGAVHPGGIAEARPPAGGAPLARMGKSKLGGEPP